MVAVSATDTSALALLQTVHLKEFRDPHAFFSWGRLGGSGPIGDAIVDAFAGNADLARQYTEEYDRLVKSHPGIMGANAAFNATYETIMNNRDAFPPEAFTIRTEFPGGGSATAEIPPAGAMPARSGPAAPPAVSPDSTSPEWRAAQSSVTSAMLDIEPATAAVSVLEDILAEARERAEDEYGAA